MNTVTPEPAAVQRPHAKMNNVLDQRREEEESVAFHCEHRVHVVKSEQIGRTRAPSNPFSSNRFFRDGLAGCPTQESDRGLKAALRVNQRLDWPEISPRRVTTGDSTPANNRMAPGQGVRESSVAGDFLQAVGGSASEAQHFVPARSSTADRQVLEALPVPKPQTWPCTSILTKLSASPLELARYLATWLRAGAPVTEVDRAKKPVLANSWSFAGVSKRLARWIWTNGDNDPEGRMIAVQEAREHLLHSSVLRHKALARGLRAAVPTQQLIAGMQVAHNEQLSQSIEQIEKAVRAGARELPPYPKPRWRRS